MFQCLDATALDGPFKGSMELLLDFAMLGCVSGGRRDADRTVVFARMWGRYAGTLDGQTHSAPAGGKFLYTQ